LFSLLLDVETHTPAELCEVERSQFCPLPSVVHTTTTFIFLTNWLLYNDFPRFFFLRHYTAPFFFSFFTYNTLPMVVTLFLFGVGCRIEGLFSRTSFFFLLRSSKFDSSPFSFSHRAGLTIFLFLLFEDLTRYGFGNETCMKIFHPL